MKKTILSLMAFATFSSAFAGGLLTNTNQNAVFLRNPARDAVIAIDGVYSNPAGIAFLPKGFQLSLSWQSAIQKRQITSNAPSFYPLNTENNNPEHFFEGKAIAPVIPSFQAAYVFNDKWSVSAQFAVGGGGGKCEFENGLPMFEQLVGGKLYQAQATSYSLNQNLTGKQYFYGLQIGATYKVSDNISVFGGVRGVLANSSYVGVISDVKANGIAASSYLTGVSQMAADGAKQAAQAAEQLAAAGNTEGAAIYMGKAQELQNAAVSAGQGAYLFANPLTLDCQQKGYGITPILGVDVNLGKLNLAAKYEFRTVINLENESNNSENLTAMASQVPQVAVYADGARVRSDIPALLTLGAQYSVLDNVRVMGGFHYFFDKDAKGSATDVEKNTWEVTLGAEWDVNNWLTVSAGTQRTKYGFGQNMQDTNFNVSSTALCLGATFHVSKMVNINAGYMHSFYNDHTIKDNNGITNTYTRKNDAVGVSVDLKF
ncbi:MAG: outer membrane beta-barrel protein [Bacteroidaceae bacterium]|nr:outer membrane beta-barrel protein [Bacteroidaceae bacterium]